MIEQKVENRSLAGWRGFALIAAIAALILIASSVCEALAGVIGNAASVLFIAFGCVVAWFLLNRYVLAFVYTANASCLRICRAYGKRERLMLDLWLNNVKACGTKEDMRKRFPGAKLQRAVKSGCPLETLAVAWQDGGRTSILLIQPDAPLKALIVDAVRNR